MTSGRNMPVESACWQRIGIWGDRSCEALAGLNHCHECPRFSQGGQTLLNRMVPTDYLRDWAAQVAIPAVTADGWRDSQAYLVFRIGRSWLALPSDLLIEVGPPRTIRRLPNRDNALLRGLTTWRGELHVCVALHGLLDEPFPEGNVATRRFALVGADAEQWVLAVDEVAGLHEVPGNAVAPLPETLNHAAGIYSEGLIEVAGKTAGVLDYALLMSALRRGTA